MLLARKGLVQAGFWEVSEDGRLVPRLREMTWKVPAVEFFRSPERRGSGSGYERLG